MIGTEDGGRSFAPRSVFDFGIGTRPTDEDHLVYPNFWHSLHSYDVCLLRLSQKSWLWFGFHQHEIGEVFEHPVVLERVVDNAEELAR